MSPEGSEAAIIQALPVPASLLGESPFWHPDERTLYWCDIPGRALHAYRPDPVQHRQWSFEVEPASVAPLRGGGLLLAMRDGLWRFDPETGQRTRLEAAPYDSRRQRFNDGKADAQGRFWVGTLDEAREPNAALYCYWRGRLERRLDGITVSNGLAFSPDGGTLYCSDTKAHRITAFDLEPNTGALSRRRTFAGFAPRVEGQPLDTYEGRPDGAAVDVEGNYWVAMFEGSRLIRLASDGTPTQVLSLPVRCATMPCFGGDDLRTLFITTSREKRPPDELAAQPLAGRVLTLRVPVPGLPVNFAEL